MSKDERFYDWLDAARWHRILVYLGILASTLVLASLLSGCHKKIVIQGDPLFSIGLCGPVGDCSTGSDEGLQYCLFSLSETELYCVYTKEEWDYLKSVQKNPPPHSRYDRSTLRGSS